MHNLEKKSLKLSNSTPSLSIKFKSVNAALKQDSSHIYGQVYLVTGKPLPISEEIGELL